VATTPPAPPTRAEPSHADREDELINHRMSWLMALNGLLAVAAGLVYTSKSLTGHERSVLVIAVSTLGALSNASGLFSNYWASRAIAEARERDIRDPAPLAWLKTKLDRGCSFAPSSLLDPPSKVLHPWFMQPFIFLVAYCLAPFAAPGIGDGIWPTLPLAVVALVFGGLSWMEHRYQRAGRLPQR
jgi:hypothetical protein